LSTSAFGSFVLSAVARSCHIQSNESGSISTRQGLDSVRRNESLTVVPLLRAPAALRVGNVRSISRTRPSGRKRNAKRTARRQTYGETVSNERKNYFIRIALWDLPGEQYSSFALDATEIIRIAWRLTETRFCQRNGKKRTRKPVDMECRAVVDNMDDAVSVVRDRPANDRHRLSLQCWNSIRCFDYYSIRLTCIFIYFFAA
jgi:hypothetical protein